MPLMYAKIFQQIYSSSIANDYLQRLVFMDMLVLADQNGVVDMTHEAIARFTNVPLDIVRPALVALEGPDPKSRNPKEAGARLVRLDDHRDWGWVIVNYEEYRQIASEDQRREKTRERVRRFKLKHNELTPGNAVVTLGNASNAKEKEKQKDKKKDQISECEEVRRFMRPTEGQCEFYASKIGLPVSEVPKFIDYYESKGWKVGVSPMKSWEAAMRNWKIRWEERRGNINGYKTAAEKDLERVLKGI